jgi:hypothetical protein
MVLEMSGMRGRIFVLPVSPPPTATRSFGKSTRVP